jgi:hypothetical protein
MGTEMLIKATNTATSVDPNGNWAKNAATKTTVPAMKTPKGFSKFLISSTLDNAAIKIANANGTKSQLKLERAM